MIYIIVFLLSLFILEIASKYKKNNKILFLILSFIAVLIPSIFAALRDFSIGTDLDIYVVGWFDYAKYHDSFFSYVKNFDTFEFLYHVFSYFSCKIFKDIFFLLLINQLLCLIPILIALNKVDDKINVTFGMSLYYLFVFNMSLNIVRQAIALSFFILAIVYLAKNNKKFFFLYWLIALLFHSSAIAGIIIYIIYRNIDSKHSLLYSIIYFFIIVVFLFNFESIVRLFVNVGIIPSKYLLYVTKYMRTSIDFNFISNVFFISIVLICYFCISRKSKENKFLFLLFVLGILIYNLGAISSHMERLSYYFLFPPMFTLIPQLLTKNSIITKDKLFASVICICLFVFNWFFWYIYIGNHETYPFIFR